MTVDAVGSGAAAVTIGDMQAPGPPSSLAAAFDSPGAVGLMWAAASDSLGLGQYLVLRDGSPIATLSSSSLAYVDAAAVAGTTYTYGVGAVDTAGLASSIRVQIRSLIAGSSA